jgi:autotransporter-associated beta strand protein
VITGSGGLVMNGSGGILILNGANTYTGGTTVSGGGKLSIEKDENIGGAGSNVLNSGTLLLTGANYSKGWALSGANNVIENGGSVAFNGALVGSGGFTKSGTGNLTLSGANTYTGNTSIGAGTLGSSGSYAGAITGGGTLVKSGSGTLTLKSATQSTVTPSAGRMNVVLGGVVSATGTFTAATNATFGLSAAENAVITANSAVISGAILSASPGSALNNVSSYCGTEADAGKILIHTTSGIARDFGQVDVAGADGLRPFLYADVKKVNDNKDLLAGLGLVWEKTSGAHGTFYLASANDTFPWARVWWGTARRVWWGTARTLQVSLAAGTARY